MLCVKQMKSDYSTWPKFDKNEDSVHALLYTDKNAQEHVRQVTKAFMAMLSCFGALNPTSCVAHLC